MNESDSDASNKISISKEDGQMSVQTTALGGWDGMCISEQLTLS